MFVNVVHSVLNELRFSVKPDLGMNMLVECALDYKLIHDQYLLMRITFEVAFKALTPWPQNLYSFENF